MCDNHKPTQGRRRILYSQQSQKIKTLALVFSLPTLCFVTRLKSGPLALNSRGQAAGRTPVAGSWPWHLTCGPRLRERYLVGPRPHVLLGAATMGQPEPAGSTIVHGDEGRDSGGSLGVRGGS